jgi:hypothetical protein
MRKKPDKERLYSIYKIRPEQPRKLIKRVRGHAQAYAGVGILDKMLSQEEKGCGLHALSRGRVIDRRLVTSSRIKVFNV